MDFCLPKYASANRHHRTHLKKKQTLDKTESVLPAACVVNLATDDARMSSTTRKRKRADDSNEHKQRETKTSSSSSSLRKKKKRKKDGDSASDSVCPITLMPIEPSDCITLRSNRKSRVYSLRAILKHIECDRRMRDPITRIPLSRSQVSRVRSMARRAGYEVADKSIIMAEHDLDAMYDNLLQSVMYDGTMFIQECIEIAKRYLSDYMRGKTLSSASQSVFTRIGCAHRMGLRHELNLRRQHRTILSDFSIHRMFDSSPSLLRMMMGPASAIRGVPRLRRRVLNSRRQRAAAANEDQEEEPVEEGEDLEDGEIMESSAGSNASNPINLTDEDIDIADLLSRHLSPQE